MSGKLITFGEALFRFSTTRGERLRDARRVDFHLGGSELNVAVNYASLGGKAAWLSIVPEGSGGDLILERLRCSEVDFSRIRRAGNEIGFYLVEDAAAPRASRVPLRQKSAFADHVAGLFDWKEELKQAWVFHSSGITAGLGLEARNELIRAVEAARAQKALVSYDCNYRRNLWSEAQAKEGQTTLLSLTDILFCSESDLQLFYGISAGEIEGFMRDSKLQYLVMSRRGADSTYGVEIWSRQEHVSSRRFLYEPVDQIGVGDSMTAGFFAALSSGTDLQRLADFTAGSGALKYSICGDMALLKKDEVDELLAQGHRSILR